MCSHWIIDAYRWGLASSFDVLDCTKNQQKKSNSYNKQAHKYVSVYLCDKNAVIRNERRVSIHKFRM